MAAVELALRALEVPEINGVRLDDVIEAGERLPGMAALWSEATVEERRDMVMLILQPGGLHYDVEVKEIAAITPRPVFLPVLRLLEGIVEYEEATGTLVTRRWQQRNRRASDYLQAYQRDRQTRWASSSLEYTAIFFCVDYSRVASPSGITSSLVIVIGLRPLPLRFPSSLESLAIAKRSTSLSETHARETLASVISSSC
jgi:hypothetical protein